MVFSSATFIFLFLPLVLAGHTLLKKTAYRNTFLLAASLFFYAWGEGWGLFIMLFSVGISFWMGLKVEAGRNLQEARRWLFWGVALNLLVLIGFKYANFLVDNLNTLFLLLSLPTVYLPPVHLPMGISFFTFQALSYVVDVYRGATPAQRNPMRMALYKALFPQLIAGPIVRYVDVREQFGERRISAQEMALGIQRFIVGLSKKVLLADPLGYVADQVFGAPATALDASAAWLGIVCYAMQIYFDFSGYSDMAIGLARMLGFRFLENFTYPYIAQSIQDFWRRWHISLSSWFRDYLYIPLGGNKKGPLRTYLNLLVVFFLCGLWHGASWVFVIWGLWHGAFLVLERMGLQKIISRVPQVARHVYVIVVVLIGWVFFRSDDLAQATQYLWAMAGQQTNTTYYAALYLNGEVGLSLVLATLLCSPVYSWVADKIDRAIAEGRNRGWQVLHQLALLLVFALSLITLVNNAYNPFIYFRF